ncbi:MAG: hypothetical protein JNG84_15550 [Archangium sp.]|nr:hypothetical protein [Archangium sp.]
MSALLLAGTLPPGLEAVIAGGPFRGTPDGFRAIALSHVADGCAGQASPDAPRCVERVVARFRTLLTPWCRGRRCDVESLAAQADGLVLAHLGLALGAAHRAGGSCVDDALHRAVAEALAARSLEDPHGIAASFRTSSLRWPADQGAVLAALHRYDQGHGQSLHIAPLERFRAAFPVESLPPSEATGRGPGARFPRGCANAFLTRYLAEVDPARASAWWRHFVRDFEVRLPLGVEGFREWPRGVDQKADVDSGPIVFGVGTAASALAISAARANGDLSRARRLETAADQVLALGVASSEASSTLALAIRFEATWSHAQRGPE